jgi:hypothetical protein
MAERAGLSFAGPQALPVGSRCERNWGALRLWAVELRSNPALSDFYLPTSGGYKNGGEGGIRTRGTLFRSMVVQKPYFYRV